MIANDNGASGNRTKMRIALALVAAFTLLSAILYFAIGLKPPESMRLATGIGEGGYWKIGERYKAELAIDGINVELLETAGSLENIEKIINGEADVAIVQGGLELTDEADLQSLGAIFLEPIAIFRSATSPLDTNPGEWSDIRLAAGPVGSGTRAAASALIDAAGVSGAGIELIEAGGDEALGAVRNGTADAMFFVAPLAAPYLMEAIFDPDLLFVPMSLVDALALKLPGAIAATVPAGAITLDPPRPPADVKVLALRASLVAKNDLHPALVDRLVNAATVLHRDRDILHGYREYPSVDSPPVPLNESARQLILNGPSILHNILPYWVAAQFGRVLLLLLPLLFILPPVLRIIPSIYVWFQKRRIWSHYQRIEMLESELAQAKTIGEMETVSGKLDQVDASLANLKLPLAYRQGAYDARLHIGHIRQEISRRQS